MKQKKKQEMKLKEAEMKSEVAQPGYRTHTHTHSFLLALSLSFTLLPSCLPFVLSCVVLISFLLYVTPLYSHCSILSYSTLIYSFLLSTLFPTHRFFNLDFSPLIISHDLTLIMSLINLIFHDNNLHMILLLFTVIVRKVDLMKVVIKQCTPYFAVVSPDGKYERECERVCVRERVRVSVRVSDTI